jgi:hypothetical protein
LSLQLPHFGQLCSWRFEARALQSLLANVDGCLADDFRYDLQKGLRPKRNVRQAMQYDEGSNTPTLTP